MVGVAPFELSQLLRASDAASREAAWEQLIARHTRLLVSIARSFGNDRDDVMERYTFILEKLREGDFRRLRAFDTDGRAQFTTWLTVAARRLCLDHYRQRYGRSQAGGGSKEPDALRMIRRRLSDSTTTDGETDLIADQGAPGADDSLIGRERNALLRESVAALPPHERLLLNLRYEDELSAARIARVLGLPTPFHVYRQLNTVLDKLRAALTSRGIDDAEG